MFVFQIRIVVVCLSIRLKEIGQTMRGCSRDGTEADS